MNITIMKQSITTMFSRHFFVTVYLSHNMHSNTAVVHTHMCTATWH